MRAADASNLRHANRRRLTAARWPDGDLAAPGSSAASAPSARKRWGIGPSVNGGVFDMVKLDSGVRGDEA